jgi:CTD small phosphatase-like protein 2
MEGTKRPNMFDIAAKNVSLPKKDYYKGKSLNNLDKKTVVFDLDETLIHCNENTNVPYDIKVPIKFPTG